MSMLKTMLVALALAAGTPPVPSLWELDAEQCIAKRYMFMNEKPTEVQYVAVADHATFIVTSPGWNLPAFGSVEGLRVQYGNLSAEGILVQRSADSVAVVWKQNDALFNSLNTANTTFNVLLPDNKELMAFPPTLNGTAEKVRACVQRQNTV